MQPSARSGLPTDTLTVTWTPHSSRVRTRSAFWRNVSRDPSSGGGHGAAVCSWTIATRPLSASLETAAPVMPAVLKCAGSPVATEYMYGARQSDSDAPLDSNEDDDWQVPSPSRVTECCWPSNDRNASISPWSVRTPVADSTARRLPGVIGLPADFSISAA